MRKRVGLYRLLVGTITAHCREEWSPFLGRVPQMGPSPARTDFAWIADGSCKTAFHLVYYGTGLYPSSHRDRGVRAFFADASPRCMS